MLNSEKKIVLALLAIMTSLGAPEAFAIDFGGISTQGALDQAQNAAKEAAKREAAKHEEEAKQKAIGNNPILSKAADQAASAAGIQKNDPGTTTILLKVIQDSKGNPAKYKEVVDNYRHDPKSIPGALPAEQKQKFLDGLAQRLPAAAAAKIPGH